MENKYILAINQGTSATKALLFGLDGSLVYCYNTFHKQYYPNSLWVEHNPEEILDKVRLNRHVGVSYEYSNLNYIILGEIIQAVSGTSYENYIEQNIFAPLEMVHSCASKAKADEYGIASGYQPILGFIRQTDYKFHPAIVPAGYLTSCAKDMSNYLIANLNGGRYKNSQVLSDKNISQMHKKSTEASSHYGLGWFDYDNLVHHGGSAKNYHTTMTLIPSEKLGIAILYNINDNVSNAFVKGNFGAKIISLLNLKIRC